MYGVSRTDERMFKKQRGFKKGTVTALQWPYGNAFVGEVTYDSCRHTAQYIQKKLYDTMAVQKYGLNQPPFQIQSQGLGLNWAKKNEAHLRETGHIKVRGVDLSIPRYYVKKLELDLSEVSEKNNERAEKMRAARIKHLKLSDPDKIIDTITGELKQKEKNILAKAKVKNKRSSL